MGIKKIVKIFDRNNVIVVGLRGTGKDMLFGNVIARRQEPYISNFDYHCKSKKCVYHSLDFNKLDIGSTTEDFIKGTTKKFVYEYPEGADIYVSDAGVYFPSQEQKELCRKYSYMPMWQALCRHISNNSFFCNVQNLNRLWDKIREHSEVYIRCNWCKVFCGFVVQKITFYDKYESCLNRVPPFYMKLPFNASKEMKQAREIERQRYFISYGTVKSHILIYRNKSKYDTRYFKKLLCEEDPDEES